MSVQSFGHIALRLFGARLGLPLPGLVALWGSETTADDGRVPGRAFSLLQSIGLALLLSGITAAVAWVQGAFGALATYAATALAGGARFATPVSLGLVAVAVAAWLPWGWARAVA